MIFLKKFTNFALILAFLTISSCGLYKKVDQREMPDGSSAKARKNINEGRGAGLGDLLGRSGNTNYEFSTANPMWRATLETLDFLPLTTVDYSGGTVITDWYSENNSNESIKITVRFLSNEIRSDSLKIIVHNKTCVNNNCTVKKIDSRIQEKLTYSVVKKAASFEKASKEKK